MQHTPNSLKEEFENLCKRNLAEVQNYGHYTIEEQAMWKQLFENQIRQLESSAHPAFLEGLKILDLTAERIPRFEEVNDRLRRASGWGIYVVDGTLDDRLLHYGLLNRKFPVTNFFRSTIDWEYTPAPDIFHEIFGHLPLLTSSKYGEVLQIFGMIADKNQYSSQVTELLTHGFWFLVEFLLERGHWDVRVVTAPGILSSTKEVRYAAGSKPTIIQAGDSEEAQKCFLRRALTTTNYDISTLQNEYFQVQSFETYHHMIVNYLPGVVEDIIKEDNDRWLMSHQQREPVILDYPMPAEWISVAQCSCGAVHPVGFSTPDIQGMDPNIAFDWVKRRFFQIDKKRPIESNFGILLQASEIAYA